MTTRPIPPSAVERISPSESTRLWMSVARAQTARKRPADLMAQYRRDDFVAPSALDQRVLHRLDGVALECASGFQAVQLSPVEIRRERLESAYYAGLRALTWARFADGPEVPIGDIGIFDWMARLTSNRKYRYVASGFGLQLLCGSSAP